MKRFAPYLLLLALTASAAHADSALDARYFDARGRAHYTAGDFAEALRAFLHAHRIAPSPTTLFNVALTAQLSGEDQLAWSSFESYRATAPEDAPQRADAASRQRAVEARVAVLTITTEPPGAQVFVDRREYGVRGVTPVRVAVLPGAHRILLEATRYAPRSVHVTGEAGTAQDITFALEARRGTAQFTGVPDNTPLHLRRDDGLRSHVEASGPLPLPVGRYEARVVSDAIVASPVFFDVTEGAEVSVAFVVRPAHVAVGRLVVRSTPTGTISVDGTPRATTPEVLADVPAGTHRVAVSAPGYAPREQDVVVQANHSTSLNIRLQRAP